MDHTFDDVLSAALALDYDSKATLAERLAIDLAENNEHLKAWVEESNRRYEMIKRGEMQTVDAREAIENIRTSLFKK
jgi:hypothetical protein